jgi:hypothetical protein
MGAVGTNWPRPQWVQRKYSCRSMRRMKAWTDSTTTGSGVGAASAARACASFVVLPAGPSTIWMVVHWLVTCLLYSADLRLLEACDSG